MTQNEKTVIDFINMVEKRQSSADLDKFYHPSVEQIEYPNIVTKNKIIRNLSDLKISFERGREIMTSEEYEIKNIYSIGDTVILESIWKGTLAMPIGNISAGGQMTTYFAQIFEFREGKIFRQRNYDCFEPFS